MANLLLAWEERSAYQEWIERLRKERRTAKSLGLEECQRCGWCCAVRTCVPTPEELEPIADHLRLSVADLIGQYMVGDFQTSDTGKRRAFLRFANTGQKDIVGECLSWEETYAKGDCLLYDAEARECRIWPVRPRDARISGCYVEKGGPDSRDAWDDGVAERLCPSMDFTDDGYI